VLEALINLNKEVHAIILMLQNAPQNIPTNSPIAERVQDLVGTWSVSVGPSLAAMRVPREVLGRADQVTSRAGRLTAKTSRKTKYLAVLHAISRVLMKQVLLEVARLPPALQLAVPTDVTGNLFPEISDLPNDLVPNALHGWAKPIKKFLKKHPFDKNVFIMVAYRSELVPVVARVEAELRKLDLFPVLAKDHNLTDDLYNPIACLLCCAYGVAIFGRGEAEQTHNPNVVYELGMMQLLKRPCVILKHAKLKRMPTDLLTRLYEDYSSQNEAARKLTEWWTRSNI
jgi:hypothetical protein